MTYLTTLPNFALAFGASLAALGLAIAIYVLVTPIREFTLVEQGNNAAAISLGGALLGLAAPIGSAIAHSRDLVDLVVWSLVALVAQLLVHVAVNLCWRGVSRQIAEGSHSHAIVLAALSVAVGLVNAACLTS
jgi:putative membrane protein